MTQTKGSTIVRMSAMPQPPREPLPCPPNRYLNPDERARYWRDINKPLLSDRLSARIGAGVLAIATSFGAGWAAHDHFDSQPQASNKTVEQTVDNQTAAPTLEATTSEAPSPTNLSTAETLALTDDEKLTDTQKKDKYYASDERAEKMRAIGDAAAQAILDECLNNGSCEIRYGDYATPRDKSDFDGRIKGLPSESVYIETGLSLGTPTETEAAVRYSVEGMLDASGELGVQGITCVDIDTYEIDSTYTSSRLSMRPYIMTTHYMGNWNGTSSIMFDSSSKTAEDIKSLDDKVSTHIANTLGLN